MNVGSSKAAAAAVAFFVFLSVAPTALYAQGSASVRNEEKKRETNDIAVGIVVSGLTCTCARFAEDIRNVVNDLRPGGMRVLPVLGVGGLQNLNDVLFLRGMDMGVVDVDHLAVMKRKDPALYANIEQRVHYIAKLYNSEFHVVARNEIQSYADLRGKKVNFNLKDSGSDVTADNIFNILGLDVQRSYYDNDEAIKKLLAGEIVAMIVLTGAPQTALAKLKSQDGVRFLPLDDTAISKQTSTKLFADYLPATLTHEHYPNMIPQGQSVPTIANRSLLAVYAWPEDTERYRRVAKFVHKFFDSIEKFHDGSRHPKWKEINLAAEIPGWTRFKAAQEWLVAHRPAVAAAAATAAGDNSGGTSDDIKAAFDVFMRDNIKASRGKPLSTSEREALFAQFIQYWKTRNGQQAVRAR
jgi:TRAP transporter TAXI family solute receptor